MSDPARPPAYQLGLAALKQLPKRLCSPPPSVGKARSCHVTPILEVTLEDVLSRKHLPPLSLKDFEEYLCFEEHSAENLYFILWLKGYTFKHAAWVRSTAPDLPLGTHPPLATSFARAKQTFFSSSSPLELNLQAERINDLLEASKDRPHPSPKVFDDIKRDVDLMLRQSFARFQQLAFTNATPGRNLCGMIVGSTTMLLGLVPVLVSILDNQSRYIRLAALPCFVLGITVITAGLHGVCLMIYVFGDARQLRSFELARPSESSPKPISEKSSESRPSANTVVDEESQIRISPACIPPDPPLSMVTQTATATFIPADCPPSPSSTVFDFEALPTIHHDPKCKDLPKVPLFAPVTQIQSPVVKRAHRDIVVRSSIVGLLLSVILMGSLMGIPSRSMH